MSYSHKILKASLEWRLDPLCEPHANAIDFEELLIFDAAPLLTKGNAWNYILVGIMYLKDWVLSVLSMKNPDGMTVRYG